jgi:hypothetical protein
MPAVIVRIHKSPYPQNFLLILILLYHVDCLFHIAENQVAVTIVGLKRDHIQ